MHRHGVVRRPTPTQRLLSVLATGALLLTLASCSGGSSTSARQLVIATLFDVSGTNAAFDLPAQYGVDLAVSQAHLPNGYTVRVVHEDYGGTTSYDPTIRANASRAVTAEVHALANNAQVVGLVGPFNSYVAALAMPITNLAGLSMISPATTTPGLTLQQYALPQYGFNWPLLHPAGHPDRFFQLAANEVEQGQLDAYVASQLLGAKTAFVLVNTTMAYAAGQGNNEEGNPDGELAQSFITAFTSIAGHTLVAPPADTCLVDCTGSLVSAVLAKDPDLVFYAGSASDGGAELKQYLVATGYTKPLLGGDGIATDPAWLSLAGAGAGNTFATMALPDVSALTSPRARAFVSAYETFVAGKPDNALSPASVMAYDATNTLLAALTRAIEQGAWRSLAALRSQTGADLASSRFGYSGISGTIWFDEQGNNAGQRIFSVYVVRGGSAASAPASAPQWALFQLVQCSGSSGSGSLSCHEIPSL